MDELIRELEELAAAAERVGNLTLREAYSYSAKLAREAQRRMAEREPAWDLR